MSSWLTSFYVVSSQLQLVDPAECFCSSSEKVALVCCPLQVFRDPLRCTVVGLTVGCVHERGNILFSHSLPFRLLPADSASSLAAAQAAHAAQAAAAFGVGGGVHVPLFALNVVSPEQQRLMQVSDQLMAL